MFQPSLEDLGQPLIDTTFVVVDLETTGGSPTSDRITEVGAVKIRGGEVIGELSTLVDPGIAVPTSITALTGISSALVAGRPSIASVLPSFLEFARGAALVAHNARFDTSFLTAALQRLSYPPLDHPVVCTAQLARRLVDDELGNRRLGTL
ncbi:MAG TPA: exonuclease domain-containing protein, partial [Euzebya sp.]|nr:exonuclease domain-containing protein [Euzebya sp.]